MSISPLFPTVTVNGYEIPSAAIADEAQNHAAPKGKPGIAWRKGAQALIIRHLLLEAARAEGLASEPMTQGEGRIETEEEALIRAYLEAKIDVESPSEAALRAVYDANPTLFRAPDLFEASHILIGVDPEADEGAKQAQNLAANTLTEVKANPRLFADKARTISACPSGKSGGLLGQHSSGDLDPDFEAALKDLNAGEVYPDPVQSQFGYHIIRCDAKARGDILPFEAVKPRLMRAAEQRSWAKAANALADTLVQKAEIEGIKMGQMAA